MCEPLNRVIGWDTCSFDLYSAAEDLVQQVLALGLVEGKRLEYNLPEPSFHPPSLFMKRAIEQGGQVLQREENDHWYPEFRCCGELRSCKSLLLVPIRNGPTIIGIFSMRSYTLNAYDICDLEALRAMADRCGGALERIRAEESLRQTQEHLRQSQKLEGIGQLAGGVAHDFNNLLVVIRGNTELALAHAPGLGDDASSCLKQVVAAADRAAELTRQLLAFSRKQIMQFRAVNLNEVIANLTKMLNRLIGEHIELQCACVDNLPSVRADVGMLEQILINLVVNARDAMPEGGQVLIATENVQIDAAYALAHPDARPGEFVCCRVRDTGTGITKFM